MKKYRKKPVVIEAIQLTEHNAEEITFLDPVGKISREMDGVAENPKPTGRLAITTLEGTMFAEIGDWIIKGIKGEYYPCKPDIFEATYEAV
jgi:hypothetical protein